MTVSTLRNEITICFLHAAHTTITCSPHHYYLQPTPLLHITLRNEITICFACLGFLRTYTITNMP